MSVALALHVLSVVVWVGGMLFAHLSLRPVAASVLEPPQRLTLWVGVFGRFFPMVWVAIALILTSGYWMLLGPFGGFANAPVFVHIMNGLGIIMVLIFLYVYFMPYPRLCKAVAEQRWPDGAKALAQIRMLVGVNMSIGALTIVIAAGGKYFL
ncbi:CopD family protein [Candidatus Thiothrix sp. Deng01]|uniref:CopD family protein n=1 Tax=Candidatus Thiothrix phosphatis TaxID=3112415 RepID=A0ABU6CT37_9GAMM|nr:CopD family protein [Candidatus Thiothrix sp. Deng01]MEB4589568.1 CopD family protein [Candidatus Thiothrix sp. Deng01]